MKTFPLCDSVVGPFINHLARLSIDLGVDFKREVWSQYPVDLTLYHAKFSMPEESTSRREYLIKLMKLICLL